MSKHIFGVNNSLFSEKNRRKIRFLSTSRITISLLFIRLILSGSDVIFTRDQDIAHEQNISFGIYGTAGELKLSHYFLPRFSISFVMTRMSFALYLCLSSVLGGTLKIQSIDRLRAISIELIRNAVVRPKRFSTFSLSLSLSPRSPTLAPVRIFISFSSPPPLYLSLFFSLDTWVCCGQQAPKCLSVPRDLLNALERVR